VKKRDLASSILWMAVGGLYVVGALGHGLIRKGVPGPGFLPFFSGLALILMSLFVLVPALGRQEGEAAPGLFAEPGSLRKLLLALGALFTFGIALEYAGYLLTTFFFMLFVSRIMEAKRWWPTVLMALVTAVLSYLLFVVLLEVQLPSGPLGL